MEIGYDRPKLLDMVQRAREGKIVLPEFQRSFVWRRDGITDLLVSILKGYFIGSFLMLRTDIDSNPFAIRTIEGVNKQPAELRGRFKTRQASFYSKRTGSRVAPNHACAMMPWLGR